MVNEIRNRVTGYTNGKPVLADIFFSEGFSEREIIIFAHGFKGFKDWGHFDLIAKYFAEKGFLFVKFNFSHNGTTLDSLTDFSDLDAFGKNTYSLELEDLNCILNYIRSNPLIGANGNTDKITLIGHSRGGGIAIIKAAEDSRIKKLITWAAVSNFIERINQFPLQQWKKEGVVYSPNARTGQNMPLYFSLYEDTINNQARFDILTQAKKISIPSLIIHGKADEAVSYNEAQLIGEAIKGSQLLFIENAGHTFGGTHPYLQPSLPNDTLVVAEKCASFIRNN